MKRRKVVSSDNLPVKPPLLLTIVMYLLLDKISAPGWVWGAIAIIIILFWIVALVDIRYREDVDLKL